LVIELACSFLDYSRAIISDSGLFAGLGEAEGRGLLRQDRRAARRKKKKKKKKKKRRRRRSRRSRRSRRRRRKQS